MRRAVFLVLLAASAAAQAQLVETTIQPAGDLNWSTTAGRTVGIGNSAVAVEAGWPGIGFTYLKGFDERTDWGFHVGLDYGLENTTHQIIGANLAIPYRHTMGVLGDTSFAFEGAPGIYLYGNGGALFAIGGPVGVLAAFKLDPRLTLDVGAYVPILVSFSNPGGVFFGPQFQAGGEYLLDKNLAVTARVRIGPTFQLVDNGNTTTGFTGLLGLAYNLR